MEKCWILDEVFGLWVVADSDSLVANVVLIFSQISFSEEYLVHVAWRFPVGLNNFY
jgi:hypothetical protein